MNSLCILHVTTVNPVLFCTHVWGRRGEDGGSQRRVIIYWTQLTLWFSLLFFFWFCLCFLFPHSVPASPCPGHPEVVSTKPPASWRQAWHQGLPTPTPTSSSLLPVRPTGPPRGSCGCHRKNMALRWVECSPRRRQGVAEICVAAQRRNRKEEEQQGVNKGFTFVIWLLYYSLDKLLAPNMWRCVRQVGRSSTGCVTPCVCVWHLWLV